VQTLRRNLFIVTSPVTVFDYDSGQAAPFTGPGLTMPTALIPLGGGTNIFAGLKQSWTSVSWEQVIKADPQCIIINDYGIPTAAQRAGRRGRRPLAAPRRVRPARRRLMIPPQLQPAHEAGQEAG
jgi:iron complex transport system substrate-binding protein